VSDLDPNRVLSRIRELAANGGELGEDVEALDCWLRQGGDLPEDWAEPPDAPCGLVQEFGTPCVGPAVYRLGSGEMTCDRHESDLDEQVRAACACIDCHGGTTLYMVRNEVWTAAGVAHDEGWLCYECLERRLNRPLSGQDLIPVAGNLPWYRDEPPGLARVKLEATKTWTSGDWQRIWRDRGCEET
jgi:hypothetical protein